ncbi:flagellar hook-basal body protein [Aminipila terrae]|uniref:Flagellar hook-basal body complex protein n=1 Tax=Aminipila terrae TaxID=2697030 RepID=A0A6P1MIW2_9FIRM|nr:flagellar hook-basal body protein [Aminipila terrae]QHI71928.1 flagellar hook-basal body complex protein [Aminipila terrae]
MDISFYTAGAGARAQQSKLDVIGNNMSNVNTTAYKSQSAGFADLLYSNIRDDANKNTQLKVGSGVRLEKTDSNFASGGPQATDNPTDYMIVGSGFFAVQDPGTNEIFYTRDGNFRRSIRSDGNFYLATANGELVLDSDLKPINLSPKKTKNSANNSNTSNNSKDSKDMEEVKEPGVFDFKIKDGMLLKGNNLFSPVAKNGQPVLQENAKVEKGYLELSNVEVSSEMSKLIETQRAYSMSLKMIQTSNEIEEVINNLR